MQEKSQLNPFVKIAFDFGPLLLFFFANGRPDFFAPLLAPFMPATLMTGETAGIFTATAVFMVAVLVALTASLVMTRRLPVMAIVTAVIVAIFGGLTLYLQNATFIKIKPTIIYLIFAIVLAGGMARGKPLLAIVFDSAFHLTSEGWRKLTLRWIAFFLFMAVLNEIIWRTQSTDVWVTFKSFGVLPLTFIFAAMQYPLMMKYDANPQAKDKTP